MQLFSHDGSHHRPLDMITRFTSLNQHCHRIICVYMYRGKSWCVCHKKREIASAVQCPTYSAFVLRRVKRDARVSSAASLFFCFLDSIRKWNKTCLASFLLRLDCFIVTLSCYASSEFITNLSPYHIVW